MKEFLIDYIEEIVYFIALLLISICGFTINLSVGLFITALMLILLERKIVEIKKILAEKR